MGQSLRVLIVEDSEDDATLLQHTLQRGGYDVTCAVVDTPSAMRAALESQTWDVITSDHSMPQFNAPEALALAKELRPAVPFIIVSGEIDINLAVSLMKGGAQDYIQKREIARLVPAIDRELREVELRLERQRVDKALIESDLKYRSLIENSSDSIFCVDEKGQYHFANQIFSATFGRDPDYFVGKTFSDIYPKEDADRRYEIIERLFRTGKSETFEITVPLPGKTLYFHSTVNPIKDETGKVILALTYATDITERKLAEEMLKESEEKYRLLHESAGVGIGYYTPNGTVISYNMVAAKNMGGEPEDFKNKSIYELFPKMAADVYMERIQKAAISEEIQEYEDFVDLPGDPKWFNSAFSRILNSSNNVIGIQIISTDITKRKRVEAALSEEETLLKHAVLFAEELLKTGHEQVNYQKILENHLFLSKAKYGAFTLLNETTGKFTTVAVAGLNEKVKQVSKLLGFELLGKEWNEYSIENKTLKGQIVSHFSSISELAGSVIPEIISKSIEKLLDIGEVTVTKVIVNNQVIGDFTLIMQAGKHLENEHLVEIYARQIDIFFARIRAEAETIKAKENFELLFNTNPDAISLTRLSDGRIVNANEGFFTLSGFTRDEVIGKSSLGLQLYQNPADRQKIINELRVTGFCKNVEAVFRRKEGIVFTGSVSAQIVMLDGVAHIFSNTRDVTDLKQAEYKLKESEETHRLLISQMKQGLAVHEIILDEAGKAIDYRFLDVNEGFELLTGLKADDVIGKTVLEIMPQTESYWIEKYGHVALTGETLQYENYSKELGKYYDVVAYSPRPKQFAVIILDVTERKLAFIEIQKLNAELEQRVRERTIQFEIVNNELEAFSYSVSHDLRSPLRRVKGFVEALRDNEDYEKSADTIYLFQRILASTEHMDSLIKALLELSRISRSGISRQAVDMSEIVRSVTNELQQANPERQVEFSIADGVTANGDVQLLCIALENLLSNALKFTAKRASAHIVFGTHQQVDGGVAYFVRDDGAGFNMDYANKLFGAFQRLHSEKEFPGIGIGLATVQRIINRHGGRIWADGVVNEGATFYFTLA